MNTAQAQGTTAFGSLTSVLEEDDAYSGSIDQEQDQQF